MCIVAMLLPAHASALVLDWNTATWTAGSSSQTYDVNGDGTNDIKVEFSGDLNTITTQNSNGTGSQTPVVDSLMEGGLSPVQPSLDIAANLHTNDKVIVTVTFIGTYAGATNVSFTLFDIDRQTNDDEIHDISGKAFPGGAAVPATISNIGSSITPSGAGLTQVLDGTSPATNGGPNSDRGNATISFGSGPSITSFTFTFQNSAGAPRFQQIALGDITFSPVPETNPAFAAAGLCGIALVALRRQKAAARAKSG